jgi:predicted ester cyclase
MGTEQHTVEQTNRNQLELSLGHDGVIEAVESLDRYYSADFVRHGDKGDYTREQLREGLVGLYRGFPDLVRKQYDLVAEDDRVAYRWEATGTHLGEYLGVRPTGRPIAVQGMVMCRFAHGQIVEEWASWNKASLLHNLGIIPLGR